MKPYLHARSSASKYGGKPEDYLKIHDWFDQTKAHHADVRHRAILHSSFGIFLCEQVFGTNIINSSGKEVSVRDIGEQHVLEDLGTIPSVGDYLKNMQLQPWMGGPSKKIRKDIEEKTTQLEDVMKKLDQQQLPKIPYDPTTTILD